MNTPSNKNQIPKEFDNAKDLLDYLVNEAKEGEVVKLDERANGFHSRRITYYKK